MLLDLTSIVDSKKMSKWLEKQENSFMATGHIGTHLDTYMKSEIPLEYFKRKGVLISVGCLENNRDIDIEDIKNISIEKDTFVLIQTGWIKKHEYGTKEYFENHPQLSNELIDFIIGKGVSFLGIDCSGIRRGEEHKKADMLCEKNGIYVIENICNLEKISSKDFTVYTMWLHDDEATGLKCRVITETN